jgi:hypothetical protein
MADPNNTAKTGGLTRGKAILIAVLGAVLVGVLYLQFGRGEAGASSEPSAYVPRRAPAVEPAASPAATDNAEKSATTDTKMSVALATVVDVTRWKSPPLEDVVDYDPFALPVTFPKPQALESGTHNEDVMAAAAADEQQKLADAISELQNQLRKLQEVGVQVIVRHGNEYVAMIGDRTLHVGEEIEGFTVTKIDPGGVVVERKAAE